MHITHAVGIAALTFVGVLTTGAGAQTLSNEDPATTAQPEIDSAPGDNDSLDIQKHDSLSPAQKQAEQADRENLREANGGELPSEIGGTYRGDDGDRAMRESGPNSADPSPAERQAEGDALRDRQEAN